MKRTVVLVAVVALALAGCKKKKTEPATGTPTTGSATATGSAPAGSGSDTMAGSGSAAPEPPPAAKPIVVMATADLKWEPMDPKAGDKGPSTAALWGDGTKEANGFLIKVPKANPGMPHTHTNGYHGVVIASSMTHQQDGKDKAKPLPPNSYWFEPGGAPHTSACPGKEDCIAFIHFNDGMRDFAPAKLDPKGKAHKDYVEKRPPDLKWAPIDPGMGDKGPSAAPVWGDGQSGPHGFFLKLPDGFASPPHVHTADYHAVVIKGTVMNHAPDDKAPKEMGPGSYWMQPGGGAHVTACKAGSECMMYGYMLGKFDFMPPK
jgi:hypothetical protein